VNLTEWAGCGQVRNNKDFNSVPKQASSHLKCQAGTRFSNQYLANLFKAWKIIQFKKFWIWGWSTNPSLVFTYDTKKPTNGLYSVGPVRHIKMTSCLEWAQNRKQSAIQFAATKARKQSSPLIKYAPDAWVLTWRIFALASALESLHWTALSTPFKLICVVKYKNWL